MGAISGSGLSLGTLWIAIEASVDEALGQLQKFGTDTGKIIDDTSKKFEGLANLGAGLSSLGQTLTLGVTAPLAAVAGLSVKAAGDFESSMNKIVAVSGATGKDLDSLREIALKLGADTKYSAKEAADGMGDLAAAGFTTKQTMDAIPGVLDLAAAGTLGVSRAAEVTASTLGQFGLAADQAGRVADVFAAGAGASAISAEDLAQSMKLVGPVANTAGISLESATTAVALLGNAGIKATEAGTGLRGIIASLESPGRKAQTVLNDLGITVNDASGKMLPLDNIMGQLAASGATTADIFKIFGRESASAAAVLIKDAGPAWASMTEQINNSQGAAKKMADTLSSGLNGNLEQLKGSVETAAIALGTALMPVANALIGIGTKIVNDFLLPAIQWFGNLPTPVQAFVGTLVALAAALGPVLLIAGQLATAIAALMPVITGLATAIGVSVTALGGWVIAIAAALAGLVALGVWVYQNWDKVMGAIESALASVARKIADFIALGASIPGIGDKFVAAAKGVDEMAKSLQLNADKHEATAKKAEKTAAVVKAVGDEHAKAAPKIVDLGNTIQKTGEQSEETGKKHKEHADKLKPLIEANDLLAAKLRIYQSEQKKATNELAQAQVKAEQLASTLDKGLTPALNAIIEPSTKWLNTYTELGKTGIPKVLEQAALIKPTIEPATGAVSAMDTGVKTLAQTSATKFPRILSDAKTAMDGVVAKGSADQMQKDSALAKLIDFQDGKLKLASQNFPKLAETIVSDMTAKITAKADDFTGAFGGMLGGADKLIGTFAETAIKTLWDGDKSFGEKGKALLGSLGDAVQTSFIGPATKAINSFISDVISDLLSGKGLGGVLDSITQLGHGLTSIFSGGASAAGGAASAAGGTASAAGGGASSVAGGAASSALGWANLGVSIISGVVSFFQGSETNKTLDTIGKHTLQTANDLANLRRDDWDRHAEYAKWKDDYLSAFWDIKQATADTSSKLGPIYDAIDSSRQLLGELIDVTHVSSDRFGALLDRMTQSMEKMLGGTNSTMNLYGTDPTTVASIIATRLRMQGGRA